MIKYIPFIINPIAFPILWNLELFLIYIFIIYFIFKVLKHYYTHISDKSPIYFKADFHCFLSRKPTQV